MTSQEVATKFASASAQCKGDRCPYAPQCTGKRETCKLVEVALIIRSLNAEIDSLTAVNKSLNAIVVALMDYINGLEDANRKYFNLVRAFQTGYRPKKGVTKRRKPRRLKLPKDLTKADGKEIYAQEPEPKPKEEVVII